METKTQIPERLSEAPLNIVAWVARCDSEVTGATREQIQDARALIQSIHRDVAHAEWQETVASAVASLKEALADQPDADPSDVLSENLDGTLIYTADCVSYLSVSPNADAWDTEYGGEPPLGETSRAAAALEADVLERIGDLDAFAAEARGQSE